MDFKRAMLEEGISNPDEMSYIQSLMETMETLRPATVKERRLVSISKKHLRELRRLVRQKEQQLQELQEKLQILEESGK